MTKIIKVEEFTPPSGRELEVSAYPHKGVFVGKAYGNNTYLFFVEDMVYSMCAPPVLKLEDEPEAPEVHGISESTLLKTIALLTNKPCEEVKF